MWFHKWKEGENTALVHVRQREITEDIEELPNAGAFRRAFARYTDFLICGFFANLILLPLNLLPLNEIPSLALLVGIAFLPLALLVETAFYAVFGNTPAKALLGIVVVTLDGERLSVNQYLHRQVGVWWYGMAAGIPLFNFITAGIQLIRISTGDPAGYDRDSFEVKARDIGVLRAVAAAVVFVVGLPIFTVLNKM